MTDEFLAKAMDAVFGPVPESKMAKIGYNVAIGAFSRLIEEVEPVLQGVAVPYMGIDTYLKNAFKVSEYDAIKEFPEEAYHVIRDCTERFRRRYEPLVEQYPSTIWVNQIPVLKAA